MAGSPTHPGGGPRQPAGQLLWDSLRQGLGGLGGLGMGSNIVAPLAPLGAKKADQGPAAHGHPAKAASWAAGQGVQLQGPPGPAPPGIAPSRTVSFGVPSGVGRLAHSQDRMPHEAPARPTIVVPQVSEPGHQAELASDPEDNVASAAESRRSSMSIDWEAATNLPGGSPLVAFTVAPSGSPATFYARYPPSASPVRAPQASFYLPTPQGSPMPTMHANQVYQPAAASQLLASLHHQQLMQQLAAAGSSAQGIYPATVLAANPYLQLHYAHQPSLGHMPAVLPIVVPPHAQNLSHQDLALLQHFLAQGGAQVQQGYQSAVPASTAGLIVPHDPAASQFFFHGLPEPSQQFIDNALQNAHAKYNAGDYPGALVILQELYAVAPRKLPVLLLLGCTCYSMGMHHLSVRYNEEILALDPSFAEAYSNLGTTFRAMAQAGPAALANWAQLLSAASRGTAFPAGMPVSQAELVAASERFYRRAVAIRPRYWDAAVNLAGLLSSQGRFAEAVEVYADLEAAMEKTVEPADRLAGLEVVGSGDLADRAYVLAVQDAERRRAERERASGKPPGTHRSSWDNLETRRDLYYAKGNLLYVVGSAAEAKKEYLKALVVSGIDVVRVMNSCHPGILPAPPVSPAQVLARKEGSPSKRGAAAQQAAATSLMMQTLAKIYQDAGMLHFAVAFYYLSLSLHPVANSCNNLGIILSSQRLDEAIAWYEVGLRLDPNHPHVLTNLGSALKDRGMVQEGIACYRRAIAIQPDFYIALANLANVYKDQGRVDDAIGLYRRALACKPDFVEAFCNYVNSLLFVCDWTDRDENLVRISHVVNEQLRAARRQNPVSIPTVLPFHTFTYASLTAYQVREISRCNAERILWNVTSSAWFPGFPQRPADVASSALAALPSVSRGSESWNSFTEALRRLASTAVHFPFPRPPPPMPDPRLRIGYVSSDIKDHPLSHLMQSVFGMHDRSRFMVVCYALSKPDDSTYSRKVAGECERFVDASSMSVQDIVAEIARDGIHILVNLNGYTKGGRNEIFAARPAPLSMQFMGFAGTMGAGPVLDEVAPAGVQPSPGDAAAVDPDPDLAFFDTMRERWIDYFVADEIALPRRTVVGEPRDIEVEQVLQGGFLPPPPTHKRRNATDTNRVYTENVVYLPHSYFVNDHRQGFRDLQDDEVEKLVPDLVRLAGTARPPASDFADGEDHLSPGDWVQWTKEQFLRLKMRQELFPGIREDTVIFANMNQSYKVDPHIFETWLNILRRVPNSVLWLLRFPPAAEKHLKRWAVGRAGEAVADRILFTDVAPKHLHIQRGRVADIFLDTPECNAHTTAADILWSGTPLVTFPKYEFKMCSRVAASVAYATGSWDAADSPVMLSELCSIDKDATTSDVAELAQKIARSKAKAVTGTGDLDWWTRSPAARELRNGQGSRVETLQNPNLLGHLMVCTSYKEYEERAVRFAAGVQWRWKDIRGCPTVPQVDGGGVDRFFPDRAAPTHIYTPSGPLVRLRRQLFLTRDKIPLFDTARWVRDVERCMLLCWERFEHGWRKVRERNAREFGGLAEAGLDIGSLELPAKRRRQPSGASEETLDGSRNGFRLLGGGAAALRSRCLWIENEDWDGQKTMG